MNKLLGFYELKESALPTIPWKEFHKGVKLDSNMLWPIRTAVHRGDDLNLPRCVGVTSEEAYEFAVSTSKRFGENGMIIYYPYFIAEKSGTLNVFSNKIVIEAVKDDLWNLVTHSQCDFTLIVTDKNKEYIGDENFMSHEEINEIESYVREVKKLFRDDLLEGKSILLEWSFAYNCNKEKKRIGDRYLVFYEVRTV